MDDFFDKVLHYYGRKSINLSLVNIGALDGYQFDDMSGYIDMYNFDVLYAEPIPEYFKKLKSNMKGKSNRRFENAAISTYDGTITMTIIPPDIVEKGLVHKAFAGMSAIDPSKNGMGSDADKEVVDKYSEQVKVKCITLNTFFKKHNIDHVDAISIDTEGHDYEIFKQLDFDKYRPKLIRLEHINLSTKEKTEIENILTQNNYLFEYKNSSDLDAIPKEVYDELYDYYMSDIGLISNQSEEASRTLIHQNSLMNNGLTLVTGLWNIDRDSLKEGWSRSYDHYLSCLKDLLNIPYNIIVFGDEDVQELVSQLNNPDRVFYIKRDKTWFKNEFYDKIQTIRTTETWMNQIGWLSESCQAKLDMYNPIVMSKVFLLNDARILDPFDSSQMYWIDAGISNTVDLRYFSENRVLDRLETNPKLSFVAFPYETQTEIHGFEYQSICEYCEAKVDKVCRGGFFGGPKDQISDFNALYYSLLNRSLNEGLMGTEESLFTILMYMHPNIFQYYLIQENGLLNTFFEDLKNDEHTSFSTALEFVNSDKEREAKIGLYIISFNSPRQLKSLVESMQNFDCNFINVPELFLLDNSTIESTFEEYSEICEAYNINHIKKENLGICGGRQFIAEHAAALDLDYYFFFEDDMFLAQEKSGLCSNGFPIFIEDLFINSLKIISNFELDFLKLSYTEFFGSNSTQWAWYNVPQNIREEKWPNNSNLPKDGLAIHPPRTIFKEIISHNGLSFATGEIYYCNWPQIVSKKGNSKMFLNQKWDRPYEQTWMSHIFQETLKGKIKPGLLMLSPIQHNRFEHYEAELRKES